MPKVSMVVNGKKVSGDIDSRTLLVQFLREELRLTGTHVGCDTSQCGCCVVHVNGSSLTSCTVLALSLEGANVVTIEGLAPGTLHAVQKAWIEEQVPQCGYCQPGFIMSAAALLKANPKPTDKDIDEVLSNICRCGTYSAIRRAVHRASSLLAGAT